MKKVLFSLLALSASLAQAKSTGVDRFVAASYDEERIEIEATDDQVIAVSLELVAAARPEAEIIEKSLASCEFLGFKTQGNRLLALFHLGETEVDDGFNGCTAEIRRNHANDEDGTGVLQVSFGYMVQD